MAKPTENKDDKNPNNKKMLEMSPGLMMLVGNGVMLVVILVSLVIMYVLIDSSVSKKIAEIAPQDEQSQMEDEGSEKQEGILIDLGDFILNLADHNARRYLKVGIAMEVSKTQEEIDAIEAAAQAKASGGGGHGGHGGHGAPAAPADPNAEIAATMERYKPAIRDAIISVLSNKTSDELSTPTGKEISKEEILEMVNNIFEGQREVMRVSYGQFIIQ